MNNPEWKTIESAPKDGTGILGYWATGAIHDCSFGAVKFHRGAWWETNEDYRTSQPTHWMTLPAAPGTAPAAPVSTVEDAQDSPVALDRLADYIADNWPDKKYGLEEICQRLNATWPGAFMPAVAAPAAGDAQAPEIDLEAAAKTLAECMDYPWSNMPEKGRTQMRLHAQAVIDAATAAEHPAPAAGDALDAERYRAIRNPPYSDRYGDLYAMTFQGDGDTPLKGDELDAAADAAFEAQRKGDA